MPAQHSPPTIARPLWRNEYGTRILHAYFDAMGSADNVLYMLQNHARLTRPRLHSHPPLTSRQPFSRRRHFTPAHPRITPSAAMPYSRQSNSRSIASDKAALASSGMAPSGGGGCGTLSGAMHGTATGTDTVTGCLPVQLASNMVIMIRRLAGAEQRAQSCPTGRTFAWR